MTPDPVRESAAAAVGRALHDSLCSQCGPVGSGLTIRSLDLRRAVPAILSALAATGALVEERSDAPPLTFTYRNHRGETALRRAIPLRVWYGSTDWHPDPQWLMDAHDLDRGEVRTFAMRDMVAGPGEVVVRLPEYDTPLATLYVVDVADEARRMFGPEGAAYIRGGPMPEHDYRLHMATPTGGRVTFSQYGTATEVMAWVARDAAERATSPAEPCGKCGHGRDQHTRRRGVCYPCYGASDSGPPGSYCARWRSPSPAEPTEGDRDAQR